MSDQEHEANPFIPGTQLVTRPGCSLSLLLFAIFLEPLAAQLRRFDVVGIHRSSITALAWSPNGMKLFSADEKGKIVYSALDLDQGSCNSSVALEEPSAVIQLDYNQKVLLVSTLQRSLLFYTEEKSVKQVGTQARKINGKFGACFIPGLCKQSDLTLFAARPGIRIWKSDADGRVQATFILKDVLAGGVKPFELYPRAEVSNTSRCSLTERHLGLVSCFFQEGWVLSWDEYNIYLLDTVNQAVIGGLEGFGDIVSVSCTDDEIFLLKGDRDILRISNKPEGLSLTGQDESAKLQTPMSLKPLFRATSPLESHSKHELLAAGPHSSPIVEDGEKEAPSLEKDDGECEILTERILLQSHHIDGKAGDSASSDVRRGCSAASETGSIHSMDSCSSLNTAGDYEAPEVLREELPHSQRFSIISTEEFDQELIVKSMKVKRKKKKKTESGGNRHDYSSRESTPSFEQRLPGDSLHFLNTDLYSGTTSLMSSLDQLSTDSPDRDSVYSGESHILLQQDNGSGAFSVLQSPESLTKLNDNILNEGTNISSQYVVLKPGDISSSHTSYMNNVLDTSLCPEGHLGNYDRNDLRQTVIFEKNGALLTFQDQNDLNGFDDGVGDADHADTSKLVFEKNLINKELVDTCFPVTGIETDLLVNGKGDECSLEQKHSRITNTVPANIAARCLEDLGTEGGHTSSRPFSRACPHPSVLGRAPDEAANACNTKHEDAGQGSSSDEDDIYGRGLLKSSSDASVAEISVTISCHDMNRLSQDEMFTKSDQLAESWMVYASPGYGILSIVVSEKYIWCLDYKGTLYCSALPGAGLRWQKYEDVVQQVAVSPSGALLWKIEQKSNKAFACGKVTIKGKRHWYEALHQTAFVALSDDTAWIIRTNGDLYLQTGLSVDRPCARAVKVDCPCPMSQITARDNVVWALTEQQGLVYRAGVSSFCPEGEQWKSDIIRKAMRGCRPAIGISPTKCRRN